MTKEQARLLDHRFGKAAAVQPELQVLRHLLLCLGGTHLVVPPALDSTLPLLIDVGFVMAGPVMQTIMTSSQCHKNVGELWAKKQLNLVGIGTGYALSDDGLWREHTWGVLREGIAETTVARMKYFGRLLQSRDADLFAITNLVDTDDEN